RSGPYELFSELSRQSGQGQRDGAVLTELSRVLADGTAARRVEVWSVGGGELLLAGVWPPSPDPAPSRPSLTDPAVSAGRMTTPVRYRGDVLGVLVVEGGPADDGDPRDERLLADLAGYVGVVVHSVRLSDELRQRVAEISVQAAELRESR